MSVASLDHTYTFILKLISAALCQLFFLCVIISLSHGCYCKNHTPYHYYYKYIHHYISLLFYPNKYLITQSNSEFGCLLIYLFLSEHNPAVLSLVGQHFRENFVLASVEPTENNIELQ